jgi:hypothetical protein
LEQQSIPSSGAAIKSIQVSINPSNQLIGAAINPIKPSSHQVNPSINQSEQSITVSNQSIGAAINPIKPSSHQSKHQSIRAINQSKHQSIQASNQSINWSSNQSHQAKQPSIQASINPSINQCKQSINWSSNQSHQAEQPSIQKHQSIQAINQSEHQSIQAINRIEQQSIPYHQSEQQSMAIMKYLTLLCFAVGQNSSFYSLPVTTVPALVMTYSISYFLLYGVRYSLLRTHIAVGRHIPTKKQDIRMV